MDRIQADTADEAAIAWFVRLRDEEATEADRTAFVAWLKADPAHERAWRELEAIWGALDRVAVPPAVTPRVVAGTTRHRPRAFWRPLAAAAMLLLTVTAGLRLLLISALVLTSPKWLAVILWSVGKLPGWGRSPRFLLAVNLLLLVLGCFLEGTTIILVILPVLVPTAQALGIDPVHFGVMAITNIMIGLVTPPYGLLLFMMTKIADVSLRDIVREVMPFLAVMLGALAIITLFPDVTLALPRLLGYTG